MTLPCSRFGHRSSQVSPRHGRFAGAAGAGRVPASLAGCGCGLVAHQPRVHLHVARPACPVSVSRRDGQRLRTDAVSRDPQGSSPRLHHLLGAVASRSGRCQRPHLGDELADRGAVPGPGRISETPSRSTSWRPRRSGCKTRFPSLVLGTGTPSLSYTRGGVMIPAESRPSRVFAQLFLDGTPAEVRQQVHKLREGQSIMDTVQHEAQSFTRRLGAADRDKLDEYFSSVRELEGRLATAEAWAHKPKPKVDLEPPRDINDGSDLIGRMRLLFDLIPLAIQTDSTRLLTILLQGANTVPPVKGVTMDHHNLSHHGKDPAKIAQLRLIEEAQLAVFRDLLGKLKTKQEGGLAASGHDDGALRQQPGQRQLARHAQPADPGRRGRLQARAACGVRREQEHAALQPVCHDAPAARGGNRRFWLQHGDVDGVLNRVDREILQGGPLVVRGPLTRPSGTLSPWGRGASRPGPVFAASPTQPVPLAGPPRPHGEKGQGRGGGRGEGAGLRGQVATVHPAVLSRSESQPSGSGAKVCEASEFCRTRAFCAKCQAGKPDVQKDSVQ